MDTRWSSPTNVVTGDTRSSAWPLDIDRSLIARAVVVGVDDGDEQEILLYDEVAARFGRAPWSRHNIRVAERPPVAPIERYTRLFDLPDGRTMAYSDVGDPCGRPWLHSHGTPSCRLETVHLHPWALRSGVRIITPDRPGFGLSSPSPAPGHAAWAQDARHLLDHLGITELAAVGGSGGAGFAMAVACALPERVRAVVLLSAACPWDRKTAHEAALVTRAFHSPLSRPLRAVVRHAARQLAELHTEEKVLGGLRGSKRDWLMAVMTEAVRQGDVAHLTEHRSAAAWDFPFTSVAQPVRIWHGASDRRASVRLARRLAASLPDAEITVVPGGHGASFEGWHAWLHAQISLPGRSNNADPCSRPSHDVDQVGPAEIDWPLRNIGTKSHAKERPGAAALISPPVFGRAR